MKKNKFKLSPAGKLTVILSLILSPVAIGHASEIVAAESTIAGHSLPESMKPEINKMPSGATEIKIAESSEHGVSHNFYTDFNVNEYGAVFNNSTERVTKDGVFYGANQQLNGSAARVIINEVTGENSSILAGNQSVVGMPADYILANANGIDCQGCSFSPEFKNVTLGVGGVNNVVGGNISINTAGNANVLSLSDRKRSDAISDNALTLISPVINTNGKIISKDEVNIIVGQNNVHLDNVAGHRIEKANNGVKTFDGYYFGSMNAKKITLIDTREDNNVNIYDDINASDSLKIKADGTLRFRAMKFKRQNIDGGNVEVYGNNVDVGMELHDSDKKYRVLKNDDPKYHYHNTRIKGSSVKIDVRGDVKLVRGEIDGIGDVDIKAKNINVDAHLHKESHIGVNSSHEKILGGNEKSYFESTEITPLFSSISSERNVNLNGKENLNISGAHIIAFSDINLSSNNDINLSGSKGMISSQYKIMHNNVKNGVDNTENISEKFKPITVTSLGNTNINAGKNVRIHGSYLRPDGELNIKGQEGVYIGVAKTLQTNMKNIDFKEWGGIAGSEKDNMEIFSYKADGSTFTGKKINIKSDGDVKILAGKIKSSESTRVESNGDLIIAGALNERSYKRDKKTGVIFDITGGSSAADNKHEKFIDSEVTAGGDLTLLSKKNIHIDGSQVNAQNILSINADGKVTVQAARQQQHIDEKNTRLNMEWFTKESSDKQYRAGFLIKHKSDSEKSAVSEHQTATLSGKGIKITGGDNVEFYGAAINTTDGDITVKSDKNVGFFTAKNTAITDKKSVETSGGLYYTGGMDKLGSGVQVSHTDKENHDNIENNLVVKTNVKGNLTINAGGNLTQQGTQHNVAKNYLVGATNINNMASNNLAISKENTLQIDGSLGQNIDHSGFTRPIEKSIKDPANTLNYIGGKGSQNGVSDPTLGVDLDISGSRTKTSANDALALVTSIKAQDIKQVAKKDVLDEGTQYEATEGKMSIQAWRHFSRAAVNSKENTSEQEKGAGSVRVGITATKDIKGHLGGKGETSRGDSYAEEMLVGNINAKSGVTIKTTGDAYYYATNIDGGSGDVTIDAGNHLYFDQVQDSQRSNNVRYEGNGKLSAGGSSGSKEFRLEGGGGYQQARAQHANAIVSKINTQGNVWLKAGADLTAKGMLIGSKEAPTNYVSLLATGQVKLLAAVSGSADINDSALADFRLGGKRATGGTSKENFIGGGAKVNKVNQSISDREGGHIYANNKVKIKSESDNDQAIHLQGLKINTPREVYWDAENGGVFIESALSELPKENWSFGANLDMVLKRESPNKADGAIDNDKASQSHYKGAGVKVMVDKQDVFKHQNTHVNSSHFFLDIKKDAVMKGARIDADSVDVDVGGDLIIESVKSREDSVKVDVELALSDTNDKGSSIQSKVSKLGTKTFEKDIKGGIDSGIKDTGAMYNKKFPAKDTMGGVSFNKDSGSVNLPTLSSETKSRNFADKIVRGLGGTVKGAVTNPEGLQGRMKVDVQVVDKDAVAEQSGIFGTNKMFVTVKGTTKLQGAEISSASEQLTLKTEKRELSNIENKHNAGGAGLNVSPTTVGNLTGAATDISEGKIPVVNNPHYKGNKSVSVGEIKGEFKGEVDAGDTDMFDESTIR